MSDLNLEVRYSDGRVARHSLTPGRYRVGRDAGDLIIEDPSVSAYHADLDVRLEAVTITDLNSRNGTFDSDGTRLSGPYSLVQGRAVRLGQCALTWLPPMGQPGGTRVMAQVPAMSAGRTEVLPARAPSVVAERLPVSSAAADHRDPPPSRSGFKSALLLALLAPITALALYLGWGFSTGKLGGKKVYSNYTFAYRCWTQGNVLFQKSYCKANVDGTVLETAEEIARYKQKLFSDGWELVSATDDGYWTTMYLRREK